MQAMSTLSYSNSYRSGLRTMLLGAGLGEVATDFGMRCLRRSGTKAMKARDRANWLQDAASTVLKRIGAEIVAEGDPPLNGLLVSNHLSYLDVLAYASLMPCAFVAKKDVRDWPVFGRFATMGGTIYVDRERHGAYGGAMALMEEALEAGMPVVLFPEGTSSDGQTVLRFRPALFEPALRTEVLVTAAAIGYASSTTKEATLAYQGEDIFGRHLVRTLGQRDLKMRVIFAATGRRYTDRKEAARTTHTEVELLRSVVTGRPASKEASGFYRLTQAG